MLGRKEYTREELDAAQAAVGERLAAWRQLDGSEALDAFEPLIFNSLVLALDRPFVHRLRSVTGKDGTPLNEVELLVDSLLNNGGVLRMNTVIRYVPERSVLGLEEGDEIRLDAASFERLADAFFAELEAKYVGVAA
jgi:hypothetical protein